MRASAVHVYPSAQRSGICSYWLKDKIAPNVRFRTAPRAGRCLSSDVFEVHEGFTGRKDRREDLHRAFP
jgi:hypothetical protein